MTQVALLWLGILSETNRNFALRSLALKFGRWQSRQKILEEYLDAMSPEELRRARPALYWIRFGQKAYTRLLGGKGNFNPLQPRWPVGSGTVSGRWSGRNGSATVTNTAQTGMSVIDNTTDDLIETLKNVVDFLPDGSGPIYGIAVHTVFGNLVRFGNFPGIGFGDVETTFGGTGIYGAKDSIRTDVILKNEAGDPIAIYDVKTGNAELRSDRLRELRDKTGFAPNIPIIELHVIRGVRVKGYRDVMRNVFAIVGHRFGDF